MPRGTITRKPNGKYLPRFRGPDGREVSRQFDRKADAQRWLDAQTSALVRGEWVDPKAGRTTVGELVPTWTATKKGRKPTTRAAHESLLRSQVLPRWEQVPLSRITHSAVAAWLAGLTAEDRAGGPLSASRARHAFGVLSSLLDMAVRDGLLARNPAAGVELPRLPQADRRYLTHGQLADLADGCGPWRTLTLVLGYCGLRWGEAAALRVRRVDLLRGRIEVAEAVAEVDGRQVFGTPKTHQRRTVVVPRFLRAELTEALAGKGPDDFVFPSRAGTPLRAGNFRRNHFDRAAAAAGLPGLTPHELRHTAASLAVASGASVKGVQAMLGHASAAMTLDRYGHLFGDELDAVADRLEAARADSLRTTRGPDAVRRISQLAD